MKVRPRPFRRAIDVLMKALATLATGLGACLFVWILLEILRQGAPSLNWAFFSQLPAPPGVPGGGILNALAGTGIMVLAAMLFGVPVGFLTGVYLSEFGHQTRFAALVRGTVNILNGIPPIMIGLFVFLLIVAPTGQYSGYAGAFALGVLIAPLIAAASEASLQAIPQSLREASLSIGASQWRTVTFLLLPSVKADLLRGVLHAVARICGLTTPLLFTALNSPYLLKHFSEPTANLTVTIFQYALSPYPERNRSAWGISLLLLLFVLLLNVGAKLCTQEKTQR